MLLRTHLVVGIFAGLLLFSMVESPWLFFLFLLFGVFIVDIDTRKSKLGRKWFFRPLQWFVSHRGVFHTLFFCLVFSGLIFVVSRSAGIGFFTGYLSHLVLDCFTRSGVKLLWPLSNRKLRFGVKSGGLIEEILFVLLLLADLFVGLKVLFSYL